ncbi:hypothetical protein AALO_G00285320 [Alosa alosa]|uniref:Uncharacterized protein n=1 Tax=Alosa alosa TaxID=278164 RepID=A0AAV6FJP1_9TELE|nr:hypothetical protein AALO_G00285320 [Alosa alosa]
MTTTLQTLLASKLDPPSQDVGSERLDGCEDGGRRYEVVPSVVCSMCCLFGIIYCFFDLSNKPREAVGDADSTAYGLYTQLRALQCWRRIPFTLHGLTSSVAHLNCGSVVSRFSRCSR